MYLGENQLTLELHYKFEIVVKQIAFMMELKHKYQNKKVPTPIRFQNICSAGGTQRNNKNI